MANVLVTGGAGFIGSHLVDYLISEGHNVTILDDLSGSSDSNINPKANFVRGSIINREIVNEVVKGKDVIYHLAAYAAEGLSHFIRRYNYTNNLLGSINLINSAVKNNVKCFLFASSVAVYGSGNPPFDENDLPHPEDPYGISKYAVELDLENAQRMYGLDYVIIRPRNVYGERQYLGDPYRNVMGIFMNRIMQGKPPIIFGDGNQTRDFTYIKDIIPCIAKAPFIKEAINQVINLGASRYYTVNQVAEEVIKAMGTDLKPVYVEPRNEAKHAYCKTEKSERILSYSDKTSLSEGIKIMAEWAKKVGPMEPIIWESYELEKGLPHSWKKLKDDFPNAKNRINPHLI